MNKENDFKNIDNIIEVRSKQIKSLYIIFDDKLEEIKSKYKENDFDNREISEEIVLIKEIEENENIILESLEMLVDVKNPDFEFKQKELQKEMNLLRRMKNTIESEKRILKIEHNFEKNEKNISDYLLKIENTKKEIEDTKKQIQTKEKIFFSVVAFIVPLIINIFSIIQISNNKEPWSIFGILLLISLFLFILLWLTFWIYKKFF